MNPVRLNIGCGKRILSGYLNIDVLPVEKVDLDNQVPNYYKYNILEGLPFRDDSVDEILVDHVLEHFYPEQVYELLWDFHRVLKPGGILKIYVPNFEWWINNFEEVRHDYLKAIDMMYALLCNVRSGSMGQHRSLWWFDLLKGLVERVGFTIDNFRRYKPSLFIEATKGHIRATESCSSSISNSR